MIKNSKQQWEIGQLVKVGFVNNLEVLKKIPTPGDWLPDKYLLANRNGREDRYYFFTPHNGLERISTADALNAYNGG
jgi:hypothetical protein